MEEHASQVKDQAQEKAQEAKEQARRNLRDQVDSRSTQAGEQVSQQARDIRSLSEQLREQGKEGPAKIAEQAADRAESVGSYLTRSDADRILNDVEDFARKNPWAVVAGGVVLGFAASRFLKASSSDRYHGRRELPRDTEQRFARGVPQTGASPAGGPATTPQI